MAKDEVLLDSIVSTAVYLSQVLKTSKKLEVKNSEFFPWGGGKAGKLKGFIVWNTINISILCRY